MPRLRVPALVFVLLITLTSSLAAAPATKSAAKPAPAKKTATKVARAAPVGDEALTQEIEKLVSARKGAAADTDTVRLQVRAAYRKMNFRPVWTTGGTLRAIADELLTILSRAGGYGLDPTDYPLQQLRDEADDVRDGVEGSVARSPATVAQWDVQMSETFVRFASQVAGGRTKPREMYADWYTVPRSVDGAELLVRAASEGNLHDLLSAVEPQSPGYQHLKNAYARYLEVAAKGGWGQVAYGDTFLWNRKDDRIPALRKRLVASGDLAQGKLKGNKYDTALRDAVARFQARHGMPVTGMVDSNTVDVLNVPVTERLREMQLNLERFRWLPDDFGPFYVTVNIPEFKLRVIDQGKMVDSMRVIVGRYYHPTPVFSDSIRVIILNPDWAVPATIARDELLPMIQQDSTYFIKRGIHMYRGSGARMVEIPSDTVQWANVQKASFPYTLRQGPGPENPLGRIKFLLPNQFDVYLHDTPSTELFLQAERDFSYGCVRLQRPLRFATDLLDPKEYPESRLEEMIATGRSDTLRIVPPVPVSLQYWTAWVDEKGEVQFRDDVYRIDYRQNWAWKQRDKLLGKIQQVANEEPHAPTGAPAAPGDIGP
ncbi:MAG TPA: L,D-transpeptidase family protein [Candidatus Eisenbacteria bacterium]|nr:L,D-transpeptidase family protein [Candidatus Eisenbacteria bacterium]